MSLSLATPPELFPLDPLVRNGHLFVPAVEMRPLLEQHGTLNDWSTFSASWERMPEDGYMADGGRYRRRRHAVYTVTRGGGIVRQPHQPHYQSRDYNPLNGGLQRWFEPVEPGIGAGASLTTILRFCAASFGSAAASACDWRVEIHQFRIESSAGQPGLPTPEGIHRDGVDYVLVLLVRRRNVASGTTTIHGPDGADLGSFTLADPLDAMLLDDRRVFHGVTPVLPQDPAEPARRDVLVVTFRRASHTSSTSPT